MKTHTITFVSGDTTCASVPGNFCRWLFAKSFGTRPVCHLFGDLPLHEKDGWLQRCDQCLTEFAGDSK